MSRAAANALLALALGAALHARPAYASAPDDSATQSAPATLPAPATSAAPTPATGDLQSPEQVSTRYSAYSLPRKQWGVSAGALGVGDGDVFAVLALMYGLGAGVELNANLAHMGVGLFNLSANWHFIDTRYFDLGARVGAWYGHGKWMWIATPAATKLVSKIDVVKFPIELTASSTPTRWLELDLGINYSYAQIFGAASGEESLFTDSELGMQQFFVRPGARLFISNRTALEFFAKLPIHSALAMDDKNVTVPFKRTWGLEGGLRSRLARGVFGTIRLHYASVSDLLYGARLYPSFELEIRP